MAAATVLPGSGATVAIGDIDESAVEDQLGPIDAVVNNAGVIAVGSAVDEDDAVTRRVLNVNIYGVILGTKLSALRMLPRGKGHIINIASLGGVLPAEGIATYCATIMPCSDTPTPFAWRTGDAAFTSRRSCRTGGRCPGSRRRDCQAETTCDRSRSMGVAASAQRHMPQRVSEALGRPLGTGRVFTSDVERDRRASYAERTGTS